MKPLADYKMKLYGKIGEEYFEVGEITFKVKVETEGSVLKVKLLKTED